MRSTILAEIDFRWGWGMGSLNQPIWQFVLHAATKLDQSHGDFRMKELITEIQKSKPELGRPSIQPVVQGMTSNAGSGPPSPCGKPLLRVEHGLYRLQRNLSDAESRETERKHAPLTARAGQVRQWKVEEIDRRIAEVTDSFSSCLDAYDRQVPFVRNGQYSWHRATINRRRIFPYVADAIADEIFLDDLYETLHAWGIGRRASFLVPRALFAERLLHASSEISNFQNLRIDDQKLDVPATASALWHLISSLGVVENISRIVPGTKTLHHLLPDLMPPMDRAWTGTFFMWSATAPQYEQEQTFIRTFTRYAQIARSSEVERYVGAGWRTSISKLLDNAIIGYCKTNNISPAVGQIKKRRLDNIDGANLNILDSGLDLVPQPQSDLQDVQTEVMGPKKLEVLETLSMGHREFNENQKGVSYDDIFGPYIQNSREVTIVDPYVRIFYQIRNLMEFIETVRKFNPSETNLSIKLLTAKDLDLEKIARQIDLLNQVQKSSIDYGIDFSYEFDETRVIHDRSITTDTGWKMILGRGLDIYQNIPNDPFNIAHKNQSLRKVKKFSVTYFRGTTGALESENE